MTKSIVSKKLSSQREIVSNKISSQKVVSKESSQREIIFKAISWQYIPTDSDEDKERFYVNGITEDEKSVVVRVDGFTPFIYVELPQSKNVDWDTYTTTSLFEYLVESLKQIYFRKTEEEKNYAPISFKITKKFGLYHKIPGLYMLLIFNTHAACKYIQYFFNRDHDIPGVGIFKKNDFLVHEQNIDPIIKMTATRNIDLGGWIKAVEYIPKDNEPKGSESDESSEDDELPLLNNKFTTAKIDMYSTYKSLSKTTMPPTIQPRVKILSFDLECYSKNHDAKISDPTLIENPIIQASIVVCRNGEGVDKWERYLLTLRKGVDILIDNVKVTNYRSERSLILGFTKHIQQINPDVIIGYNIMKFDWNYLIKRADMLGIYDEFALLGRIVGVPSVKIKKDWESSAYGSQKFEFLEPQGRLTVDVLPEIERNHKFDTYSLNYVSDHFLKEHKDPVSAKDMFKLYQFADLVQNYFDYDMTLVYLKEIKEIASIVFQDLEDKSITLDFYNTIRTATKSNIKERMAKAMKIIGEYCVQDSVLPIKLIFKLNILLTLEHMSNIFCVPISYLQTRGQQVKVLAQVYRYTLYNNYVIPFKKYNEKDEKELYQGATVIDAVPGYWENIATLDFASLYPSVMIANNIDFSSYVDPFNDNMPDEDCNVVEWEDHVGCQHDPAHRKKKKGEILCGHHRHKFRKVVEKDGVLYNVGVLPYILKNLLAERSKVKKQMGDIGKKLKDPTTPEEAKKDLSVELTVLDAKQLAIKISANSAYGGLGARTGYFPLIPGAASTTAKGREYIGIAIKYILKSFPQAKLVYGDTDSCMIRFEGCNLQETFDLLNKAAIDVTALFPQPVSMAPECVYGKFLLLSKKRYLAFKMTPMGVVFEVVKKGIVLKRRDNTHYLKDVYGKLMDDVMNREPVQKIFYDLYDNIHKLFTLQVEDKDLVIYKSINDVMSYAKKVKLPDPSGATVKVDITEKSGRKKTIEKPVMIEYFLGKDKKPLMDSKKKPTKITSCLDDRLLYDSTAHVMLGLKMISRGDQVPANTRLQYLFMDTGVDKELQGNKVEEYVYYKENKGRLPKLDYLYYLEKQIIKPVSEVISVLYSNTPHTYISLSDRAVGLEKLFKDEAIKESILKLKKLILNTTNSTNSGDIYKNTISMTRSQVKRGKNPVLSQKFEELVKIYYIQKSSLLIDRIEKVYGLKKHAIPKPDKKTGMIVKDGNVMKDILRYRTGYRDTVRHLNHLFSRVEFEETDKEK